MKFNLKHLGSIEGGKITFDDPKAYLKIIKDLEGKRVELVIKKFKEYKERSLDQNAYYWGGIVTPLAEELGYTTDEMHEVLKMHFLGTKREVKGRGGKVKMLYRSGSTASLSTAEFEALMSKIRSWASLELGIYLLSPDEYQRKISNEKNQM